jgi:hypothetical protein
VVARVASSYGAPDEVADIYRDTEVKVAKALRTPPAPPRRSLAGRFFGVIADPRAYAGLFYMVLALATGIAYFTVAVTGLSLSAGLAILIIGVPFIVLFVGIVRLLSLVEGRIVETLLGVRMPRRPLYANRGKPFMERVKETFTDPRTWSTLLYMVLMLPLGIVYFTVIVTALSVAISCILAPVLLGFGAWDHWWIDSWEVSTSLHAWQLPIVFVSGVVLLFATLHLARGIGRMHGLLAKHLLVKSAQYV